MEKQEVHPMRSVPDALRTVLHVTATIVLQRQSPAATATAPAVESIPLSLSAVGRQLAESVVMPEPGYPPYPASIMDGYCIRTHEAFVPIIPNDENDKTTTATHVIVDKVYAGDSESQETEQAKKERHLPTAIYITTGGKLPLGYDCVVPIEECRVLEGGTLLAILSSAKIAVNQWIRPAGCDLAPGEIVLPVGHVLDAVSLALARQAACTKITVQVTEPVVVVSIGILSTGNELIVEDNWTIEQGLTGKIPDVNRPMLQALVSSWGVSSVVDLGMCRDDDIPEIVQRLKRASEECPIIIATGGISMGETDVMEHVLVNQLGGTLHFGRLHMKPGKPTTFLTLPNGCLVFALPGNPVSAYVCASLLVQPCWNLLSSSLSRQSSRHSTSSTTTIEECVAQAVVQQEVQAQLTHDIPLDMERPEYHRVTLEVVVTNNNNIWQATSTGTQRSSRLASLRDADGLLVLPQGTSQKTRALAGEEYTVLLWKPLTTITQKKDTAVTTVRTSRHLNPPKPLHVSLVELSFSSSSHAATLATQARSALTGSKSGSVHIGMAETVTVAKDTSSSSEIWDRVVQTVRSHNNSTTTTTTPDVLLIVTAIGDSCSSTGSSGMFPFHPQLAHALRTTYLNRVAHAMAHQVRAGAASADPTAALWDAVVGFTTVTDNKDCAVLVVFLSSVGFEAALSNVRGLLKHALAMARSQNHHNGDHHHHP